jgi:protein TonB
MRENGAVTIPQSPSVWASYGALELKRSYQKHLGLALIAAGTLHLAVIGGFLLYTNVHTEPPQPVHIIVIDDSVKPIPPPPISMTQDRQVQVDTRILHPISLGIATAFPDEEVDAEGTVASQDELGEWFDKSVESILVDGRNDSVVIIEPPKEYLPQPGEYIYRDEDPLAINQVVYQYPPLALEAGIEGTVWVEALVDQDGKVRDARVVVSSGCHAGFEESALEAAYKIKYKPALSNGQPVAVRVTYPVYFRLK